VLSPLLLQQLKKAKKKYEACDHTSSKEKIQQTQTEASTAKSHAIHATVVEYGASIAKKRCAVSLFEDIKVWNTHRKIHLLQTSIQVAKSHLDASRKAADALISLINSSVFPHAKGEVITSSNLAPVVVTPFINAQEIPREDLITFDTSTEVPYPQNHFIMKSSEKSSSVHDRGNNSSSYLIEGFSECVAGALKMASPTKMEESVHLDAEGSSENSVCFAASNVSHLDENYFSFHQGVVTRDIDEVSSTPSFDDSFRSEGLPNKDVMSSSMQSLIDDLMAWGGDDEETNEKGTIKQSVH